MTDPFHVPFLAVEGKGDLAVSIARGRCGQPSRTLFRTPKCGPILDERECGVSLGASAGEGEVEAPVVLVLSQWTRRKSRTQDRFWVR